MRTGGALVAAALVAFGGACAGGDEATAPATTPGPPCDAPGEWARSADAAWLHRAARLAGFAVAGCTGSAWVVVRGASAYVWTTSGGGASPAGEGLGRLAGTTVRGGQVRVAWRVQDVTVWLEPGPGAGEPLPSRGRLAELVLVTRLLPRRPRPIELMETPWGVLRKCRSSALLRPACPRRIPRVPGWRTYPSYGNPVDTVFGVELGGEHPGKPELNRPPGMLHLELVAARGRSPVPFAWPDGPATRAHDGLARAERHRAVPLGARAWGGRRGRLVLAPPYPSGGSQGNHLLFSWRDGGATYVVGLHSWEPFTETVATLQRVVESIP